MLARTGSVARIGSADRNALQGRLSIENIRQILADAADESDETETVQ
jgi:hypothetical protein